METFFGARGGTEGLVLLPETAPTFASAGYSLGAVVRGARRASPSDVIP